MSDLALFLLVQQLQQELQNQRTEIQSLRLDLDALRVDVHQLQLYLQTRPTPALTTCPRLPDPPRFDGKPLMLPEDTQSWDPEDIFFFFQRLCHNLREQQEAPDVSRVMALHRGFRPALRQSLEESSDTLFSLSYSEYVKLKPIAAHEPMDIDLQLQTASLAPASYFCSRPPSATSSRLRSSSAEFTKRRAYRIKNGFCLCYGARDHWIA
ncbi:hypothetical protein V2W45_1521956 [Cenococcum geophilum]